MMRFHLGLVGPPVWLVVLARDVQACARIALRVRLAALLSSQTTSEAAIARSFVHFG